MTLQIAIVCLTAIILAAIVVGNRAADVKSDLFAGLEAGTKIGVYLGEQLVRGTVRDVHPGVVQLADAAIVVAGQGDTKLGNVRIPIGATTLVQEL